MSTESTSRCRVMGGLRSRRTRALLSMGMVLGLGSVTTLAYWTDSATLTGGTFASGTIDLRLDGSDNNPSSFSTAFAMSNLSPGQSKAVVVPVGSVAWMQTLSLAPGAKVRAVVITEVDEASAPVNVAVPVQVCVGLLPLTVPRGTTLKSSSEARVPALGAMLFAMPDAT